MPVYGAEGRSGNPPTQDAACRLARVCHVLAACCWLVGCADPLAKPIDLYHGLEGGEIAAERPPPPGAGLPYPHVGLVPAKPVLTSAGFRTALQTELAAERDQKELLAADLPQEKVPPPPNAGAAAPPAAEPVPAPSDESAATNATIPAADAPPPATPAASTAMPAAPQDAGLQIIGTSEEYKTLPLVPDGPPAPASVEGGPPAPYTPPSLPQPVPLPPGKFVYFANGSAVLTASQTETLNTINGQRGRKAIDVIGLGEAGSDTPLGQEAAIDLALRRARAVADAFLALHVPRDALHLSARAYGRGALIQVLNQP
jgi:outer membrane protein OmpA-like peptidoglycan-associated protein